MPSLIPVGQNTGGFREENLNVDLSQVYFHYPTTHVLQDGQFWTSLWVSTNQLPPYPLSCFRVADSDDGLDSAHLGKRPRHAVTNPSAIAIQVIDRIEAERSKVLLELEVAKRTIRELRIEIADLKKGPGHSRDPFGHLNPRLTDLLDTPVDDARWEGVLNRALPHLFRCRTQLEESNHIPSHQISLPRLLCPAPQSLPFSTVIRPLKQEIAQLFQTSADTIPTSLHFLKQSPDRHIPKPETCLGFLNLVSALYGKREIQGDEGNPTLSAQSHYEFAPDFLLSYDRALRDALPRPQHADLVKADTWSWVGRMVSSTSSTPSAGLLRFHDVCFVFAASSIGQKVFLFSPTSKSDPVGWVTEGTCRALLEPFVRAQLLKNQRDEELTTWTFEEVFASETADEGLENIFSMRMIQYLAGCTSPIELSRVTINTLNMVIRGHPPATLSTECQKDILKQLLEWMFTAAREVSDRVKRVKHRRA